MNSLQVPALGVLSGTSACHPNARGQQTKFIEPGKHRELGLQTSARCLRCFTEWPSSLETAYGINYKKGKQPNKNHQDASIHTPTHLPSQDRQEELTWRWRQQILTLLQTRRDRTGWHCKGWGEKARWGKRGEKGDSPQLRSPC